MKKIEYPKGKELVKFNNNFVERVSPTNVIDINCYLNRILFEGEKLDFKTLSTLSFGKLLLLKDTLYKYSKTFQCGESNSFNDLFNYTNRQGSIARFFMSESSMNFKTCFYCNIDFINSFVDLLDYNDGYEFLNQANKTELMYMERLGDVTADKIITYRKKQEITASNINAVITDLLLKIKIKFFAINNTHNHFTLDHFLPQSKYPFFSLCLYNLIPSCYSCNTKFKVDKSLSNGDWNSVSPSSSMFSIDKDFKFKIFFSEIASINNEDDFKLRTIIDKNEQLIKEYLKMFKIEGRYKQHKDEILRLIKQRVKYSDEKIDELMRLTRISKQELKKMIFGYDLFTENRDIPLNKMKKDIAVSLNIITKDD